MSQSQGLFGNYKYITRVTENEVSLFLRPIFKKQEPDASQEG